MKKQKLKNQESLTDAYSLFLYAIRSQLTRDYYLRRLRTFFDFIKLLPSSKIEQTDYDKVIERAKHDKVDYKQRMFVVPVSFNEYGRELLGRFQQFVSKGWIAISPIEHKDLVTQMRMAKYKDNGNLDKEETSGNTFDAFDSCHCALMPFYTVGKL